MYITFNIHVDLHSRNFEKLRFRVIEISPNIFLREKRNYLEKKVFYLNYGF